MKEQRNKKSVKHSLFFESCSGGFVSSVGGESVPARTTQMDQWTREWKGSLSLSLRTLYEDVVSRKQNSR